MINMKEIRKTLFSIVFEKWLISIAICSVISLLLNNTAPLLSFWWLFLGNIVGATIMSVYFYIKKYAKIKELINTANEISDRINDKIQNEITNKETKKI